MIVKATHYELDTLTRTEYFTSRELADTRTAEWGATTWGRIYLEEIEVTDR